MRQYAVVNGEIIDNLIVADNLQAAELITGQTCIEYNQEELRLTTSWKWDGNNFIDPDAVNEKNTEII